MPDYPESIAVGETGRVILLYDHGETAVITLTADGNVGSRYRLEQLLAPKEIKSHVTKTVSHRLWRDLRTLITFSQDRATIELSWGKRLEFNLNTGDLRKSYRSKK